MSVLRLLTVYNEKDIIRQNIEFYASQGIETIVLDNYSKDGTYEILKEYEGRGVRWIERYKTDFYDIRTLNTVLIKLAKNEKEKFFIWIDADEFLYPFNENFYLKDVIKKLFLKFPKVDAFNVSKVEFYHTDKSEIHNFKIEKMNYFYFESVWKDVIFRKKEELLTYLDRPFYFEKLNLDKELKYKSLKYLFYIKHYPFRTIRQAKKKVFRAIPTHLRNQTQIDPKIINWHLISMKNNVENSIVRSKDSLIKFDESDKEFYKKFVLKQKTKLFNYYNKIEKILGEK